MFATTLRVAGYDNNERITTSFDLTGEDVRNTRRIRLSASHRKEIKDGAGSFVISAGGSQDVNVRVGQSLNINFY